MVVVVEEEEAEEELKKKERKKEGESKTERGLMVACFLHSESSG